MERVHQVGQEANGAIQHLLDEPALAACLAYVDLNPIRAGLAETPETSRFTAVYERIQALRGLKDDCVRETGNSVDDQPSVSSKDTVCPPGVPSGAESRAAWLSPFELLEESPQPSALLSPGGRGVGGEGAAVRSEYVASARASNKGCLPMTFPEYLALLDWTGRQVREDKRGVIPADLGPIFERLHLSGEGWLNLVCEFRRKFRRAAGTPASLSKEAQKRGCRKMHGIVHSRAIFDAPPQSNA